jgi:hypothetical protein
MDPCTWHGNAMAYYNACRSLPGTVQECGVLLQLAPPPPPPYLVVLQHMRPVEDLHVDRLVPGDHVDGPDRGRGDKYAAWGREGSQNHA